MLLTTVFEVEGLFDVNFIQNRIITKEVEDV